MLHRPLSICVIAQIGRGKRILLHRQRPCSFIHCQKTGRHMPFAIPTHDFRAGQRGTQKARVTPAVGYRDDRLMQNPRLIKCAGMWLRSKQQLKRILTKTDSNLLTCGVVLFFYWIDDACDGRLKERSDLLPTLLMTESQYLVAAYMHVGFLPRQPKLAITNIEFFLVIAEWSELDKLRLLSTPKGVLGSCFKTPQNMF